MGYKYRMASDTHSCEHCLAFDSYLSTCNPFDDRLFSKQWKDGKELYLQKCSAYQAYKARNQKGQHKGNGTHNGLWAGTLTTPPNEHTEDDMTKAMGKIFAQKSCPLKRYAWYMEYTEIGTPHIHFIYETETGGRIEAKHFKRYWPIWNEKIAMGAGHRGGYHKAVYDPEAYQVYISKDNGKHQIVGF